LFSKTENILRKATGHGIKLCFTYVLSYNWNVQNFHLKTPTKHNLSSVKFFTRSIEKHLKTVDQCIFQKAVAYSILLYLDWQEDRNSLQNIHCRIYLFCPGVAVAEACHWYTRAPKNWKVFWTIWLIWTTSARYRNTWALCIPEQLTYGVYTLSHISSQEIEW